MRRRYAKTFFWCGEMLLIKIQLDHIQKIRNENEEKNAAYMA